MVRVIGAIVLTVVGFVLLFGRGRDEASAGPAATFMPREGWVVGLRRVGETPWQGRGMRPSSVIVLCGDGGFAVGQLNDYYFGLNGHTAQWSETGKIVLPSGTERRLWKPERQQLARIGAIEPDADPFDFNRPIDAGLDIARRHCTA